MKTPHAPPLVAASGGPFPEKTVEDSLPRAPVLGYLAGISTPTRARRVAALGVVGVAIACLLLEAVLVLVTLWQVDYLANLWAWGPRPGLAEYLRAMRLLGSWSGVRPNTSFWLGLLLSLGIVVRIVLTVLLVAPGLGLLILARAVYLGRSLPSRTCVVLMVPFIGLMFPAFAVPPCAGIADCFGRHADFSGLGWLLIVPPGALLILLLKDLCSYLLWIGRNPMMDKPRVPFVGPGN